MAKKSNLNPELSAREHAELIGSEIPYSDLMVMAVWADVNNGENIDAALKKHGISEEFYDENVDRVLES